MTSAPRSKVKKATKPKAKLKATEQTTPGKTLAAEICRHEGLKHQAVYGDVQEILKVLKFIFAKEIVLKAEGHFGKFMDDITELAGHALEMDMIVHVEFEGKRPVVEVTEEMVKEKMSALINSLKAQSRNPGSKKTTTVKAKA